MAAVRSNEQCAFGGGVAVRRIAEVAKLCRTNGNHPDQSLGAILEAAIELTGADRGNIQILDPSGALAIVAQQGFEAEFLSFFARVEDTSSACGLAMYAGEQIVVDDVVTSDIFVGTDGLGVMLRAGVRAVQSTPLIGSAGKVVGMISTHYGYSHRPKDAELAAVSLLAGVAADHLEHADARQSARRSAESLNTLLDILPIPVWISRDPECRDIRGNAAGLAMFGVTGDWNLSQTAAELGQAPVIPHYRNGRRLRADELPMQRAAATGQVQQEVRLDIDLPNGDRGSISGGAAPLFDDDGKVRGVVAAFADVTALRRAEEAREAMARELLHRGANLLTVVQALTRLSFGGLGGLTEAYDKLERRLQALARANRLLTEADRRGVHLRKVVAAALDPFTTRFEFDGEDARLGPTQVQNLTIALHELGTNAIKYGALSEGEGVIAIEARVEPAAKSSALLFRWRERGGPSVTAPAHVGQGTRLLRTLYQDVSLEYAPDGLRCEIRVMLAPE